MKVVGQVLPVTVSVLAKADLPSIQIIPVRSRY